jgi:hypothetical protein
LRIPIPGLVCLLATGLLSAQYPGQYPPGQYPPGQYPPGQYPGSQSPFPRIPFPGRGKKPAEDKKASAKEVLEQFSGKITKVEKDSFSIEASDTRLITFRSTKDTTYVQEGEEAKHEVLKPGMDVSIEARSDDEGFFYAVNVSWKKPGEAPPAPSAPPSAKQDVDDAPQQQARAAVIIKEADPENPDVPKLRRGKPAPRPKRADEPVEPVVAEGVVVGTAVEVPAPEPLAVIEPDPFLEKAIEMANSFEETLPNYLCNQFTTRFQGEGKPINWVPLDVVSAAVVYQDGKETYQDIKINNKAVNKPMEEIPGSWSRGEFGTTLRDLFSPATAADFKKRRESTASGRSAVIYDFDVKQTNSHWQTVMGGQSVMPAYSGSVWIDKETARVLRIEMQAKKVPTTFPLDTIEWVVDYSFVRIGGTEYLLPAHAANLACWRGTSQCARSTLDFRNYRKFGSESQIIVTDSTVSFEGEESSKPAPAGKKK